MKKLLVLVALAALVTGSAYAASIKGSKHDLSTSGGGSIKSSSTEVCVFCHTPHGAITSTKYTPLWNRTDTAVPTANYASSTYSQNGAGTDVITTDAYLCLSCHDGAQQMGALQNQPNTGSVVTLTNTITGGANLALDLSNDHPIGFVYTTAATADGTANLNANPAGITFAAGGEMWCSTCHDVHNPANGQFLVINNAGSNLCVACHVK